MEEQDSIRLQKKIILVLSIVLFLIMIALSEISNDPGVKAMFAFVSNESSLSGEELETAEQIAYAALESIEQNENTEENDRTSSVDGENEQTETIENNDVINEEEVLAEREQRVAKAEVSRHESTRQQLTQQTTQQTSTASAVATTNTANYVSYKSLAENNPPAETEYTKVIEATATAYCLCQKCCGKLPSSPGYGVTASGYKIVPGTGAKVIAVDPRIIPLGSNVYVEGLNGAWDYGHAVAADTGGAIKNIRIDLYMDSHAETLSWGVRKVNVYILGNQVVAEEAQPAESTGEAEAGEITVEAAAEMQEASENAENAPALEVIEETENLEIPENN